MEKNNVTVEWLETHPSWHQLSNNDIISVKDFGVSEYAPSHHKTLHWREAKAIAEFVRKIEEEKK